MKYRPLGKTGFDVSALALGGHEYHPDGRLKGISDEFALAIKPGYTNGSFASPERRRLVKFALEQGINYFDVTIDPEVDALKKCFAEIDPLPPVLMQCRPQAMCYRYNEGNKALADPAQLRPEVERLIALSGRGRIDVLNFGFEAEALADADYFRKLAGVIAGLKKDGLIRFAACDSLFSGEPHYLRMIESGLFDIVWITLGPLAPWAVARVLPRARERGMGVVVREAFAKGELFKILGASKLPVAPGRLAAATIRWVLSHSDVSSLVIGARNADELQLNLQAAERPLDDEDKDILKQVLAHAPEGDYPRPEVIFAAANPP